MKHLRSWTGTIAGEPALLRATLEEHLTPGSGLTSIYCTGYTGQAITAFNTVERQVPFNIAAQYGAFYSIHAGGTATFGNDAAVNSTQAFVTAIEADRPGPYLLIGGSMGFCDLMAWARLHPERVAGVLCLHGLVDLTEQWTANRDLGGIGGTALINAAYGGTYDPATHGPTRNPIEFLGDLPFPILAFYSTDDPLIPMASMLTAAEQDNFTAISVGALGHYTPAQKAAALTPEFRAFIEQAAAA